MPASSSAPFATRSSTPPDTVPLSLNELSRFAPGVHAAWVRGAALAALVAYLVLPLTGLFDPQRHPLQIYTELGVLASLTVVFWLLSRGRSFAAGTLLIAALTFEFHASLVIDPEFPITLAMGFPVLLAGTALLLGGDVAIRAALVTSVTAPAAAGLGGWLQHRPGLLGSDPVRFVVFAVALVAMAYLMRMGLSALGAAYRDASESHRNASQLGRIVEETQIEAYIADVDAGRFVTMSRGARRNLGYGDEDVTTLLVREVSPSLTLSDWAGDDAGPGTLRSVHRRRDGSVYPVEIQLHPGELHGRRVAFVFAVDISERIAAEQEQRRLQLELQEAQKMDAIGQLAGGIAHDFNNLLMAIGGFAEMICEDDQGHLGQLAAEIVRAQARGTLLTRQLLAFARKGITQPRLLDLADAVRDLEPLLARLAGEGVRLVVDTQPVPLVFADRGQIDQVLVNLVANARDALADHGTVTITVRAAAPDLVHLIVDDDGRGMDEAMAARIFEPFFSTKPRDKGTGLGLAVVHGIVAQNGGTVGVRTAPGQGTTMTVALAVAPSEPVSEVPADAPADLDRHRGATLLVAEDDDGARALVQRLLERSGYRVMAAAGGQQALERARAAQGRVDLLLTDVVMPGISGFELARRFREEFSGVPVLYMSGYTDQRLADQRGIDTARDVIYKPFSGDQVRARIAAALQERDGPGRG